MSSSDSNNPYEKDEYLQMYLDLHFPVVANDSGQIIPKMLPHEQAPTHALGFPDRVAQLVVLLNPQRWDAALDIGCAVGGTAFSLARSFQHVDAFDSSETFIEAAHRIQTGQSMPVSIRVEGEICQRGVVRKQDDIEQRNRVSFFVGDACDLEQTLANRKDLYDAVVMANLLCRLPDPMACLDGLASIVREGGVVLLVTPFTWLEQYTPKDKWIGAIDENQRSVDVLAEHMKALGFIKIHDSEMPLVIREHQRKYQYIISKTTGWRKRS